VAVSPDAAKIAATLRVLLLHKNQIEVSTMRLAHIAGVSETKVLECLNELSNISLVRVDKVYDVSVQDSPEMQKNTIEEAKPKVSYHLERCKVRYSFYGKSWNWKDEDYIIFDIAQKYVTERTNRTKLSYKLFAMDKDPRKQMKWKHFAGAYQMMKDFGYDADQFINAQFEYSSRMRIVLPTSWLCSDKARDRMDDWLSKNSSKSDVVVTAGKDQSTIDFEQSKHLVETLLRTRKDCKNIVDVLNIPGIIEQLSPVYLEHVLSMKEMKV